MELQMAAEVYKTIIAIVDKRVKEIKVTRKDFDHLEAVVSDLTEAQKKAEQELASLVKTVENLQKEVGDLSNTIGYKLENAAYKALPHLILIENE